MSKRTANSLFILPSMPRLYQHLLTGLASYEALGSRIIRQIKAAHTFRDAERVRELSVMLNNIPIEQYKLIGEYYLVWCKCREREYDTEALERIIDRTSMYKAKGLLSRAAFDGYKGNLHLELYFYNEALKAYPTISERIDILRAIAVVKAKEGFHRSAIKDLEKLIPVIKHADALVYFDYLNSYAVELIEAGRTDEARNISRIVLASPFAFAYPEWQETARDLKGPNRSFVAVPLIKREPIKVEITQTEHASKQKHESDTQPAKVVSFPPLKEAPPPKKPERLTPREINQLTASEKRELILAAIRSDAMLESDYDKMMIMAGLLKKGPADKILDLEDEALLDDIIVVWSNQIEPEELAAVLSALRDCDDDLRRNGIIDRMIRIAFEQTQLCGLTEEQWRLRVERRLPKK